MLKTLMLSCSEVCIAMPVASAACKIRRWLCPPSRVRWYLVGLQCCFLYLYQMEAPSISHCTHSLHFQQWIELYLLHIAQHQQFEYLLRETQYRLIHRIPRSNTTLCMRRPSLRGPLLNTITFCMFYCIKVTSLPHHFLPLIHHTDVAVCIKLIKSNFYIGGCPLSVIYTFLKVGVRLL